MAIFSSKGGTTVNMMAVEGIPNIHEGMAVSVNLLDDAIQIQERISKKDAMLPYDRIVGVEMVSPDVMRRAIVSNSMFGDNGAVVGGMSGNFISRGTKILSYLILSYRSKTDDMKNITLAVVGATIGLSKFIENLKNRSRINLQRSIDL